MSIDRKLALHQRIDNDFTYHAPHGNQTIRYNQLRLQARHSAHLIVDQTPVSREQSLALTSLEQATFLANAAIARNEQPGEPQPEIGQWENAITLYSKADLDRVYSERNKCVALIAQLAKMLGMNCGIKIHQGENWEEDWRHIFFLDLPSGQVSWHLHDSELENFPTLRPYTEAWDEHDTNEKYRRVIAFASAGLTGEDSQAQTSEGEK